MILSLLYTMTEILRTDEDEELREQFIQELSKFFLYSAATLQEGSI